MRTDTGRIGADDRRESVAKRREIGTGLGLGDEPGIELAGAAESPQPVAVLTHEEVGGVDVAEMVEQETIDGRGGGGGNLGVHRRVLEQFPIEADRRLPIAGAFGGLTGLPQDGGRGRRLGVEPRFDGGERLCRPAFRQARLEDVRNRALGLGRSGFVGGDLVVEGRGGSGSESKKGDEPDNHRKQPTGACHGATACLHEPNGLTHTSPGQRPGCRDEPNGLTHTSPGQRPGLATQRELQAEGLLHKTPHTPGYEAGLQPANHGGGLMTQGVALG